MGSRKQCMTVLPPNMRRTGVAEAARGSCGRDQGDSLEGTTPVAQALLQAGSHPKGSEKDHHCTGMRTVGLHLGNRNQGGNSSQAADSRLTKSKGKSKNLSKE